MSTCTVGGPNCPDTSHGQLTEPCARCGCARRTHHPVQLTDGGIAWQCRGHHLSGGHSGMVQQCGCREFEPRITHCEHGRMTPSGDPDVECCCCSLSPCDSALADKAAVFIAHVQAQTELNSLHAERAIRYVLAHGKREAVPF